MSGETITLSLGEATDEQLRAALTCAERVADSFNNRGDKFHTWNTRVEALRAELRRRTGTRAACDDIARAALGGAGDER